MSVQGDWLLSRARREEPPTVPIPATVHRRELEDRAVSAELASLGADSRDQTLATLGSTTLKNTTTTRGCHPCSESVRTLTLNIAGLVGALHDSLLLTDLRFYSVRGIRSRDRGRTIPRSEIAPLDESLIIPTNLMINPKKISK